MELDEAIKKRHSVRSFKTTKKPDYRDIISAIEAATKAPLAGNIPSLKFILVSDKEKIKELAEAAQQKFIAQANYVVVVCSDKKTLVKHYYERGERYAKQQAGAAIENFLLKLTDLGLATCWIGAFSDETVKRILRIPDDIDVEAMFPVGYELSKEEQKTKPSLDRVMFFESYGSMPYEEESKFMKPKRAIPGSKT